MNQAFILNVLVAWLCVLMVVSAEPIPPDAFYSLPEIVTSKGYPSETHHAITKDGYNLTLFRIPYGIAGPSSGTPRPPVILQHGLLDFSFTWILNMPNQSLSYVLADAGFDVWMPNNRGNKESRLPNANLNSSTPEDREWWQFSWDQMALYDVPGVIGYVTSLTGFSKVSYIGHSEGSLQMFAALVALPEVADLVSSFQAFGPVAYANHLEQTTFRKLAEDYADVLYDAVDGKLFAPLPDWIHEVGAEFCAVDPFACDSVIEWICGPHKGAFNNSRMPVVGAQEPGGTSALNMVHWGQMVRQKEQTLQMFDYGEIGNLKNYGQRHPPVYDLSKYPTSVPTWLWSGGEDILADPVDVSLLIDVLPNSTLHTQIPNYAHLDYVWAIDAVEIMYPQVIEFIKANLP